MTVGPQQGRVSVVVPVYNVAPYVSRCVESVLKQTHTELEVILVDDGSTDGGGELCEAFAARDSRIKVIHQTNAGLSSARNVGLTSASAGYVTFLDGDDWWEAEFVETLLLALDDHPAAVAAMSSFVRVPGQAWSPHVDRTVLMSTTEVVDFFAGRQHTLATMACAKLFRRPALQGVTFPEGRLHEDEFTTYRALMRGPAVLVPLPLYNYRQRSDGITAAPMTPERLLDAIMAADQQAEDLLAAGHRRAAAWAQDQGFRKRMRLVALLERADDRDSASVHLDHLVRSARAGRSLPRSPAVRAARLMAARWPQQSVRAFTLVGAARARARRGWHT